MKLQHDMDLIGITGVEDKLQDEVATTIQALRMGGVKIWMLTGDKMETAENIAKSCRLIQSDFHILRLKLTLPKKGDKSVLNLDQEQ